ncbi:MAG: hypothetical protein M3280_09250 [Actinomycetota bacterium]|nr:hypothetical protein [Actinomycetota bacterium]
MNFISYERFGVNFVSRAVNLDRVKAAVAEVAGDSFRIGPMGAGPGGVAVVQADGEIGSPVVEEIPGLMLKFDAKLPITLNLEVRLATVPQRYRGEILVPLSLSVRTVEPLTLLIEVEPIVARDVSVDLRSAGMSAGLLKRLGNIDDEVRKQVAQVVNGRLDSKEARASREIDVGSLIDKAMTDR